MIINTLDDKSILLPINILQSYSRIYSSISDGEKNKRVSKLNIDSQTLEKVIEFLNQLTPTELTIIPKPIPNGKLETFLNPIESNFLSFITKLERQAILKMADDLGLEHLANLMLASFASEFIGMTALEFLKNNNIMVEYTPELEREIQKNNDSLIKGN